MKRTCSEPIWYSLKTGKRIKPSTARRKLGAKKYAETLKKGRYAAVRRKGGEVRVPSKGVVLIDACPTFTRASTRGRPYKTGTEDVRETIKRRKRKVPSRPKRRKR